MSTCQFFFSHFQFILCFPCLAFLQHIYQKWNERLFAEMLDAYKTGRWGRDPVPGWYEGELGFFDNYVIPLAKKLKDCGVFGVSSDEVSAVLCGGFVLAISFTAPFGFSYLTYLSYFPHFLYPYLKLTSLKQYLNYALENRREWASKGEECVKKMVMKYGAVVAPVPPSVPKTPESPSSSSSKEESTLGAGSPAAA
jgi:hypothetical protein